MTVSVRKVEKLVHETGVGVEPRTDVVYELGDEIDGVWVAFASVTEHRLEDFKQRAEREAEAAKAAKPATGAAAGK